MKEKPASSRAFTFAAESIPASATTTMSVTVWRSANAVKTSDEGLRLGLVALEHVDLQGEPGRIDQEPDLDLRVDAVLLAHPHPPQGVLFLGLEVQRRDVVHDHGCHARAGGVGHARPADRVAVVTRHAAVQAAEDRAQRGGGDTDVLEDPDRVRLRRRLDDPRQHEPHERLVADLGEAQTFVGTGQDVPQDLATHPRDLRPRDRSRTLRREVERLLPGVQQLPGRFHQDRELDLVVRRADVIDPDHLPALLVDDLNGPRARCRRHPTDERGHDRGYQPPD